MLKDDVKSRLIPVFLEEGFAPYSLPKKDWNSELRVSFPFGHLKRKRNGELEIVEIQFDKFGVPKFVVNFGIIPKNGVTLPWGDHITQEEADTSVLPQYYRLYSSKLRSRWFGLGFFSVRSARSIKRVVDRAIDFSPEVKSWFEEKSIGKHVRMISLE